MIAVDPGMHLQMWLAFALIALAVTAYAFEWASLELVSLSTIVVALLVFHLFPVAAPDGANLLDPRRLLEGFADPALAAIVSLLIIGQALVRTGALDGPARHLVSVGNKYPALVSVLALLIVMTVSAFLNNTPVVVIFIPIISALAERMGWSVSGMMMPLSMAAILGGMLTLIGSSTNLLVSASLGAISGDDIGFFDFTVVGAVLAGSGFLYIILVAPRLLPDRASLAGRLVGTGGRQFIAQIEVTGENGLAGEKSVAGMFTGLPEMTVRLIQRDEDAFLPPFDDITLRPGDAIIVAATRQSITELLSRSQTFLQGVLEEAASAEGGYAQPKPAGDRILAEAVIAPASRLDGRTLSQAAFRHQTNCIVLGIQRRSRMIRAQLNEIRLTAGDVLLVIGKRADVLGLRSNADVLLVEWTAAELPATHHAKRAISVFLGVVLFSAFGILPIAIATMVGAALVIAMGCINVRQAGRAVDRRIVLMIAAALAMGAMLQTTGGAAFLAHGLIGLFEGAPPAILLSAFFLLIAVLTNLLSNNATAVLFTPIGYNLGVELGIEPIIFVHAVIFAANCSFATPMGYQTNLLVMGPGHYRFSDFLRAGTPLIILIWLAYSFFAPWYYGF